MLPSIGRAARAIGSNFRTIPFGNILALTGVGAVAVITAVIVDDGQGGAFPSGGIRYASGQSTIEPKFARQRQCAVGHKVEEVRDSAQRFMDNL
ncbi:hypothetical protein DDZ14_18445 [Maritimibacter sp. 55A14]|nr:hypothetical protein DDZ14_18445 [Maritimibacter sp. 55A14]